MCSANSVVEEAELPNGEDEFDVGESGEDEGEGGKEGGDDDEEEEELYLANIRRTTAGKMFSFPAAAPRETYLLW
jgi:hypothetical protein